MTEFKIEFQDVEGNWFPELITKDLPDSLILAAKSSDSFATSGVNTTRVTTPISKNGESSAVTAVFYKGRRIYWFNEDTEWRLI